jgi:hypothetical protein
MPPRLAESWSNQYLAFVNAAAPPVASTARASACRSDSASICCATCQHAVEHLRERQVLLPTFAEIAAGSSAQAPADLNHVNRDAANCRVDPSDVLRLNLGEAVVMRNVRRPSYP